MYPATLLGCFSMQMYKIFTIYNIEYMNSSSIWMARVLNDSVKIENATRWQSVMLF